MGIRAWIVCTAAAACAASAAGCGSAPRRSAGTTQVTVPAYGVFPATTVESRAGAGGAGPACRAAARSFADDSVDLLAHFGASAAYPADLNYVIVRSELAGFRARGCDLRLLGLALERRLTPRQREDLVADLPRTMGTTVRDALARAGSS